MADISIRSAYVYRVTSAQRPEGNSIRVVSRRRQIVPGKRFSSYRVIFTARSLRVSLPGTSDRTFRWRLRRLTLCCLNLSGARLSLSALTPFPHGAEDDQGTEHDPSADHRSAFPRMN